MDLIKTATISDFTRCTLALIVGGVTAFAVATGQPMPSEWLLLVGAVFGFYFGLEVPVGSRKPDGKP